MSVHQKAAIVPTLHYSWLRQSGDGVVISDGPLLHNVHEVSAGTSSGRLRLWARGRMLRRDGEPGPNRGVEIDTDAPQPAWLRQIISDAGRRLNDAQDNGSHA